MRLPHILHMAAFFAYFSKVHIAHIFFCINWHLTAILIFFVLQPHHCWTGWLQLGLHWHTDMVTVTMCVQGVSCGYTYDVRFMQICNCGLFPPYVWCLYGPHIFKNMLHKTDMPNKYNYTSWAETEQSAVHINHHGCQITYVRQVLHKNGLNKFSIKLKFYGN